MSTLTRRDRVAVGAVQGGALYYGPNRRWPEPAPGVFEKFGSPHPGGLKRPPTDKEAHEIQSFIVSDLDGTPKLYSGYGGALINKTPVYVWPLGLDGTWDPAPAHTFNAFGLSRGYLSAEGKLWCHSDQGPSAFCSGSPGGTWIDGKLDHPGKPAGSDGGMTHAHGIARHDGYTWVRGQYGVDGRTGAVWRGTTPTGSDGEYLVGTPLGLGMYSPHALFSYQGKLWMQPAPDFEDAPFPPYEDSQLCYWDEAAYKFLPIDLRLQPGVSTVVPWKTVMLMVNGYSGVYKVETFNGTTLTTVYESPFTEATMEICVTADDTVWLLDNVGVFRSSTDLVTWTERMRLPSGWSGINTKFSFTVYGDFVYTGDNHDQIWRAKVTP